MLLRHSRSVLTSLFYLVSLQHISLMKSRHQHVLNVSIKQKTAGCLRRLGPMGRHKPLTACQTRGEIH